MLPACNAQGPLRNSSRRAARTLATRAQLVSAMDGGRAPIDHQGPGGLTAVSVASRAGAARALAELLRRGADAYVYGDGGVTPMMLAARGGHLECMRVGVAPARPVRQQFQAIRSSVVGHMDCSRGASWFGLSLMTS